MGIEGTPQAKLSNFYPNGQEDLPTFQVIGTPEQWANFENWLSGMTASLHASAFEAGRKLEKDLNSFPAVAPAEFWANQKAKSTGSRYGKRSFQRWASENGHTMEENGLWRKEIGLAWLYG